MADPRVAARLVHAGFPVSRKRTQPGGEVRVIAGEWRSRRIAFPELPGLRPTPDRVRETLFNWLGHDLEGFRCLDLYAGSGALGFEAHSRGASQVIMVENNPVVVRALEANATRFSASRLKIVRADALEFLRRSANGGAVGETRFDVVFIDPPFDQGVPDEVLSLLPPLLATGGLVYMEAGVQAVVPQSWKTEKQGKAGQVHFQLMRWEP